MTTRATTREIDFSTFPESDGEPMAETLENQTQMIDLMFALRRLLREQGRTRVAVGGNQFLYYNEHNGRDHCSPDVYVALDVEPGNRPTWKTWVEGKCPDIVFDITSPSMQDEGLGPKRTLYARLVQPRFPVVTPELSAILRVDHGLVQLCPRGWVRANITSTIHRGRCLGVTS